MRPLGRARQPRRIEDRRAPIDYGDAPVDHRAKELMAVIDDMPRRFRDVINEHNIEQAVYDRLPSMWQFRIEMAMTQANGGEAGIADVWDD
jgi:hypothetical protein